MKVWHRRPVSCSHVRWIGRVVCVLALGAPAVFADATDDYNVAAQFYKQERWDAAARSFRTFLQANPDHPQAAAARLYLGQALVHQRKFSEARDVFRDYVRRHSNQPDVALARFRVGESSYFLQDDQAALRELDEFLQHHPDHELVPRARLYRGQAQLRGNDAAAAAETLSGLIDSKPDASILAESQYALARAREALNQPDQAVALYEELAADRENPFAVDARFRLASIAFERQDYGRAAELFAQVASEFPQHRLAATASMNAGYAEYSQNRIPEALAHFAKAAEHPEQAGNAALWTGLAHKKSGDFPAAAAALRAAYEQDDKQPLADKLLFHWADSELRAGNYAEAQRLFVLAVDRWKDADRADDSLHLATEAALRAGDLEAAEKLNTRFEREYSGSGLRWLQQVLAGRIRIARGDALRAARSDDPAATDEYRNAAEQLARVVESTEVPETGTVARVQLARALDRLGESERVVEALEPVVAEFRRGAGRADVAEALLLHSRHLIATGRHEEAAQSAELYLQQSSPADAPAAWSELALAKVHLGDGSGALKALDELQQIDSSGRAIAAAAYRCAEAAYAAKEWELAAALFERTAEADSEGNFRAAALSGLGYSQHEAGQHAAAAETFAQIVQTYPDDRRLASNAAHMRGLSLQLAGDLEKAAVAYDEGTAQFAPSEPPREPVEIEVAYNAYRCGKGAGRAWRELGRVDEADAAYERAYKVLSGLPSDRQDELDRLINEWALLSYENKRYERSDELFRLLIEHRPDSDLADDARLYLAESQFFAGKLDDARAAFDDLARDPRADEFVQHRSAVLLLDIAAEQEDWTRLLEYADRFLQKFAASPQRPYAQYRAGEAALQLEQHERAIRELAALTQQQDPAVSSSEWYTSVWILLAEAYFRSKDYPQVEATIAQFRERFPDSTFLYHADEILGRSYMRRAMLPEARELLTKVTESETGRRTKTAARAQFHIAETYVIEKNYDAALAEYYKVYVNYPYPEWQAPALFQAGQCDESLENWRGAAQSYETLVQEFPDSEFAERARARLEEVRSRIP